MLAIDVPTDIRQQSNAKSKVPRSLQKNEITEREIEFNVITAIEF